MARSTAAAFLFILIASDALALSDATADKDDRFPYVVEITFRKRLVCSGTVLYPRIVVTAAHCVHEKVDWRAKLFSGDYLLISQLRVVTVQGGKARAFEVERVVSSPVWRANVGKPAAGERYAYDLALIITKDPLDVVPPPSVASLMLEWAADEDTATAQDGATIRNSLAQAFTREGLLVGFGAASCASSIRCGRAGTRRYRPVEVEDAASCFNDAIEAHGKPDAAKLDPDFAAEVNLSVWCMGWGIMPGDSGGPLLVEGPKGELYFVGVISSRWGSYVTNFTKLDAEKRSFASALYPSFSFIAGEARKLGYIR
jgi:hypothetical protein